MEKKVAITGGIGSGKSYVCGLMKSLGIEVYDCDAAAKRLMLSSEKIRDGLTSLIGNDAYIDGHLNKQKLTSYLLESDEHAKAINAIVHPVVAQDFILSGKTWMECAILFESGFDKLVNITVCITAPTDIRIERIMQRDSISKERATEWINCQMEQNEVAKKCDFVIINDGKQEIKEQIKYIIKQINK